MGFGALLSSTEDPISLPSFGFVLVPSDRISAVGLASQKAGQNPWISNMAIGTELEQE